MTGSNLAMFGLQSAAAALQAAIRTARTSAGLGAYIAAGMPDTAILLGCSAAAIYWHSQYFVFFIYRDLSNLSSKFHKKLRKMPPKPATAVGV